MATNWPGIKCSNSEWIGVLARCIITFAERCPTNILWHWEFDDSPWKVKISWAFNSALPLKNGQEPLFLWRKSGWLAVAGKMVWRGKTWHVFVGLKLNVATQVVQRKIKTWLLKFWFVSSRFWPFFIKKIDIFLCYNWLLCLSVEEEWKPGKIGQNIVRQHRGKKRLD